MEHILQPGDTCCECHRLGQTRKLRYFYINLEEKILKCESDECIYPYVCEDDKLIEDSNNEQTFIITELEAPVHDANRCINNGMEFIDELLNDIQEPTRQHFEPPAAEPIVLSLNYDLIKQEEPHNVDAKPDIFEMLNAAKIEKVKKMPTLPASKIVKLENIKIEKNIEHPSQQQRKKLKCTTSTASSSSSTVIPKAFIRRYLNAADMHTKSAKPRANSSISDLQPQKRTIKLRKHKIKIKKKCAGEPKQTKSSLKRPLDFMQTVIKSKSY